MVAADMLSSVGSGGFSSCGSGLGLGLLNGVTMMGEDGRIGVNGSDVVNIVLRDDISENVTGSGRWMFVISGAKRPRLSLVC